MTTPYTPDAEAVGTRIRTLREARGYSPDELAEHCACTGSAIRALEAGRSIPGGRLLSRLADALLTSTDYLLGRATR